ncbi:capsular biosynthesis protein [Priestia megaterium]|nr:capsular biosynthesis protein [Priestia megaterium]
MIDIHTYILPNIDSGPKEVQGFLNMARSLVKCGVTSVVATPVFDCMDSTFSRHELFLYASAANDWLDDSLIPLRVLPGQLIPVSSHLLQHYKEKQLLTLNHTDKYLLLSLPNEDVSPYLEQVLYDLQLQGIVPILQSPECYPAFRDDPEKLYDLVKQGVITQLNAGSILGLNGKKERKAAFTFMKHRLAHVIASGANGKNYWDYSLSKAYDVISDEYGTSRLYTFMENAEAIVDGRAVRREEPEAFRRMRLFKLWA